MRWFIGKKTPGVGDLAYEQLMAQNIICYEPRIKNEDGELEYLWPSYILVACDGSRESVARVNATRGMKRLLPAHCELPLALPIGYVEELRLSVESFMTIEKVEEVNASFSHGQRVDISCGPYAGQSGTYEGKKKGSLKILMALLGMQVVVHVPLQNVSVVESITKTRKFYAPQLRRKNTSETSVARPHLESSTEIESPQSVAA